MHTIQSIRIGSELDDKDDKEVVKVELVRETDIGSSTIEYHVLLLRFAVFFHEVFVYFC